MAKINPAFHTWPMVLEISTAETEKKLLEQSMDHELNIKNQETRNTLRAANITNPHRIQSRLLYSNPAARCANNQ